MIKKNIFELESLFLLIYPIFQKSDLWVFRSWKC